MNNEIGLRLRAVNPRGINRADKKLVGGGCFYGTGRGCLSAFFCRRLFYRWRRYKLRHVFTDCGIHDSSRCRRRASPSSVIKTVACMCFVDGIVLCNLSYVFSARMAMKNSRDTLRIAAYIRAVNRPLTLTGRRTVAIIPASSSERKQRSIVRGASPVFSAKRLTDTCTVLSCLLINFKTTCMTAWQFTTWSYRIARRVSAWVSRRLVHRRPRLVSDGNLSGVANAHAALRCMFASCGCGWHSFKNRSQFIFYCESSMRCIIPPQAAIVKRLALSAAV